MPRVATTGRVATSGRSPVSGRVDAVGRFSLPWTMAGVACSLEGDLGITLNGAKVLQWNDQSAAGNHISETSAPNQPSYLSSALNGLPGVQFVLSSSTRLWKEVNVIGSGAFTMGVVFRVDAETST